MDLSNDSTLEALNDLKSRLTKSDFPQEVLAVLPTFISCFERNEEVVPELVSVLLGPTVKAVPIEDIDNALLQPILPLIKQYISQIFSTIAELLQRRPCSQQSIEISKKLRLCINVQCSLEELVLYLLNVDNLTLSNVYHLPKVCTEIVHHVFLHCQKSNELYGEVFSSVRTELMCLFQKCHKIQVALLKLLNEKLYFDCSFENELRLLVDVLEVLGWMAHVVVELDTMSLVSHWKGYTQLVQTYAADLRPVLDISSTVSYLADNISHQMRSLSNSADNDKKLTTKSLKVTSLQLKVLIKLCEHYKGYLKGCHKALLICLVNLSAYSSQYLKQQGVAGDIADQITTLLSAGAAPLLSHLIDDLYFHQEFVDYSDSVNIQPLTAQIGFYNLICLVMRKLMQLSLKQPQSRELWLEPDLLTMVFALLESCNLPVSCCEDDLYQSLLTHTASYIVSTCTVEEFAALEDQLVKQLLQPTLWPAIFSSDLLCLVARLGSSELCLQLVNLVTDLLSVWPAWDYQRPEWVYVSWSRGRLLKLLSTNQLLDYPASLPLVDFLARDISSFCKQPSGESLMLYESFTQTLRLYSDTLSTLSLPLKSLAEAVLGLWQFVRVPADCHSLETSHWFHSFFTILVSSTCSLITHYNNTQLSQILDDLIQATDSNSSVYLSASCELLKHIANKTLESDSHQDSVCAKISLLFSRLLKSGHPVTQQLALETFSHFAYVTKYEQIVPDTVVNDDRLQAVVTKFFEAVPISDSGISLAEHLKMLERTFAHKCKIKKVKLVAGEVNQEENPCKRLKTGVDEMVTMNLQQIDRCLCNIEQREDASILSQSQISLANNILIRLTSLVKET